MTKKTVALLCGVVVMGLGIYVLLNYFLWTSKVQVTSVNTENAVVYTAGSNKEVASLDPSKKNILRLKDDSYVIRFQAKDGYADSEQPFEVKGDTKVSINPKYTEQRLSELLKTEKPVIDTTLVKSFPKINLYEIQRGELYDYGDWYGTTLYYKGDDDYNADMLRVILHKESGAWVIKTPTPSIFLNNQLSPGVPDDIVSRVNEMPVKIQNRFAGPDLQQAN